MSGEVAGQTGRAYEYRESSWSLDSVRAAFGDVEACRFAEIVARREALPSGPAREIMGCNRVHSFGDVLRLCVLPLGHEGATHRFVAMPRGTFPWFDNAKGE